MNRRWKALVRSERALKQLKSWASTSVVNAIVRASTMFPEPPTSPPGSRRSSASSVTTAITAPTQRMPTHISASITRSVSRRGGRRMTSSGGGSTPSASAGAPSVSRLIQRIWVASSGTAIASPVSSSPITPGEHDAEEHREDLADVRREQEAQELADVREDPAALADGADDRGEVVVGEDHVRRLLGDVGAGDAHRDADVGRLQRGRVVDAVAGHRDDPAVGLQRVDDPQLVLGRDAGVDGDLPHRGCARVVVERLELGAR